MNGRAMMKKKKPTDYGITKNELHRILKKASQPVKKKKSDSKKS